MDWFDGEIAAGFLRKLIGAIGRLFLILADVIADFLTFGWDPTDKRARRKERRMADKKREDP